jgi:hypothetical protein
MIIYSEANDALTGLTRLSKRPENGSKPEFGKKGPAERFVVRQPVNMISKPGT